LEENISKHAAQDEEEKEGMPETRKRNCTPIFEESDSDDAMTKVEWRAEEPYMMPTKQGRKRNKGKGRSGGETRPQTPERPIPNMLRMPSRRMWNADWAKPAGESTSVKSVNLEAFIREYLKNTSGLRDFMVGIEKYDDEYAEWGNIQAKQMVAKQNYTEHLEIQRSLGKTEMVN